MPLNAKTGNRIVGSTIVGKGNRVLNDGTYAFLYDTNGNLTRRTTLVSGAPTGAYVQYSWDHRNQLTKVEFYNAPVNGTATLAKTVTYTYDDSSNRINKTLTVPPVPAKVGEANRLDVNCGAMTVDSLGRQSEDTVCQNVLSRKATAGVP